MGLDIYLYECEKPVGIKYGQFVFNDNKFKLLPVKNNNGNNEIYCKTIMNNSTLVKKKDICINYEKIYADISEKSADDIKILKDYGCELDIRITSFSNNEYAFYIDGFLHTIDTNTIRKKYSYEVINEYYAICMHEIAYQRGLSDDGWDYLPHNCEYCDDLDRIHNLIKNGLNETFIKEWIENKTVLLAWW